MPTPRLFLLPGLGADERLFGSIENVGIPVVSFRLPVPGDSESFIGYASRIGAMLQLRPEDWVGGCSFGSLIAADISRRRPTGGLVLIGGALSPASIRLPIRLSMTLSKIMPVSASQAVVRRPEILRFVFNDPPAPAFSTLMAMLADSPPELLLNGIRLMTRYRPGMSPLCPVHAIHGGRDRLMRPPPVAGCQIVPDAGHGLVMTHGVAVNGFLRTIFSGDSAS